MICPNCGREVDDSSSFCPNCGKSLRGNIAESHSNFKSKPVVESSAPQGSVVNDNPEFTPENFRNLPTYKPNLIRVNIFLGLSMIFNALALLGSLLLRFGTNPEIWLCITLLVFGAVMGIIFMAFGMTYNKKTFPQVNGYKLKGPFEVLPAFFMAFSLSFLIGALVVQGIYLIIY